MRDRPGGSALSPGRSYSRAFFGAWLASLAAADGQLYVVLATVSTGGNVRSSPAITYIPDENGHPDRWVFVTSRGDGGKLLAFKTDRQ